MAKKPDFALLKQEKKIKTPEYILVLFSIFILLIIASLFIVFRVYFIKNIDNIFRSNIDENLKNTASVLSMTTNPNSVRDIKYNFISAERALIENTYTNTLSSENLNNIFLVDTMGVVLFSTDDAIVRGSVNPYLSLEKSSFEIAKAGMTQLTELYNYEDQYLRFAFSPITNEFQEVMAILVIETGAEYFNEIANIKSFSTIFSYLFFFTMLFLILVLLYTLLTISKLRNQLQQTAALAAISKMTSTIAHEIRNPLQIIKSSLNRLKRKTSPEDRTYINYIDEEIDRIDSITEKYLSIIKHETNKSKININTLLFKLVENYSQNTTYNNITFELKPKANIDIYASESSLTQVIHNLLQNSINAIETEGKVIVEIGNDSNNAYIKIIDNGKGFSNKQKKRLFQPFFSTRQDGTGLGLYITKTLVETDNGKISAFSNREKTVFTISYPLILEQYE